MTGREFSLILQDVSVKKNVNIAFMKLFRETKGDIAYSIIEFDGTLPDDAEDQISLNPYVQDVIFIPIQRRI